MVRKGFVRKLWKFPVEDQRALLAAEGLRPNAIYEHEHAEEDIAVCLGSFRGDGGTLYIAADMRVFGSSQDEITAVVDKCELAHIRIVDLAHPELKTISAQQRHAFGRLAEWARWGGDTKRARETGRLGPGKRAENAATKRAERIPDETVRKLVRAIGKRQMVTWRFVEDITGLSASTIRRHYS